MKTDNRFESIDRDMSSYVVACQKKSTLFFLTDEGLATDILSRAKRHRWEDKAVEAAESACAEYSWSGFDWQAMSVPEAFVKARG